MKLKLRPLLLCLSGGLGMGLVLSLSLGLTLPRAAQAASSASSAASDSVGSVSNSVSGSLNKSSDSSTTKQVAQGEYRIVEVLAVVDQPAMVTLALLGTDEARKDAWFLTLPATAFERSGLAPGQTVAATPRPYGVEFSRADNRQAFFLVLADEWMLELPSRRVQPVVM